MNQYYDNVTSHELYLTPQMQEAVEIVGAQISWAALGVVHDLRRSVRFGFELIKGAALTVLQRHVDPTEQLCRLVHRGTSLYGRHHIVFGVLRLLEKSTVRTAGFSG